MADWQVGDLALCVKSNWEVWSDKPLCPTFGPKAGDILKVVRISVCDYFGDPCLNFFEYGLGDEDAFAAVGFRKITPGADIEGIEVERKVKVPA